MLISTQRLWGQAKCLIPLPMHSPTNQPIHPPIGKEVFTDYKSSNRIKLSQIVQDLFLFQWFDTLGFMGWVSGWVGEWVRVWVGWRNPHACACMYIYVHACMHMLNMDASMVLIICNFSSGILACSVYMCMCMHACVHVGALPHNYPSTHHHSCQIPGKIFPVFTLDPNRPCLDWDLISFLTSQPIYDPFKSDWKWRQKWEIWLWHKFSIESSTTKNLNAPLDALLCPLQIINVTESLSLMFMV